MVIIGVAIGVSLFIFAKFKLEDNSSIKKEDETRKIIQQELEKQKKEEKIIWRD